MCTSPLFTSPSSYGRDTQSSGPVDIKQKVRFIVVEIRKSQTQTSVNNQGIKHSESWQEIEYLLLYLCYYIFNFLWFEHELKLNCSSLQVSMIFSNSVRESIASKFGSFSKLLWSCLYCPFWLCQALKYNNISIISCSFSECLGYF